MDGMKKSTSTRQEIDFEELKQDFVDLEDKKMIEILQKVVLD